MCKYYFLYKTTNLINNKIYYGCHQSDVLNDDYLGSGKALKSAIKKYGRKSFKREIIEFFDSAEEMYKREAEIVTDDFIKEPNNYNMKKGGEGGFSGNSEERSRKISEKSKNLVGALNLETNKIEKVTTEEFYNSNKYVGQTKNKIVAKNEKGEYEMVTKEDFIKRNLNGSTKGKAVMKDKEGKVVVVDATDERILSGELVGVTKGTKQTEESNLKRSKALKGRKFKMSFLQKTCEYCGKTMNIGNYGKWHKDGKCLQKANKI